MDLLKRPAEQSRRRLKDDEPLKLFEMVVKLMEVTYGEYLAAQVKIHFPFVASLFQGPVSTNHLNHKENAINNFHQLISLIFSVGETSKEFILLMV